MKEVIVDLEPVYGTCKNSEVITTNGCGVEDAEPPVGKESSK